MVDGGGSVLGYFEGREGGVDVVESGPEGSCCDWIGRLWR